MGRQQVGRRDARLQSAEDDLAEQFLVVGGLALAVQALAVVPAGVVDQVVGFADGVVLGALRDAASRARGVVLVPTGTRVQ